MTSQMPFLTVFGISILLSLLVAIFPLPSAISAIRPELLCLVVMYWVLYRPHSIGVGIAWVIGFIQDIIEGEVWGAHALALAFVAYLCLNSYQRLRSYSLLHQTMWIFVFVGVHQLFVSWIQGMEGYTTPFHHMIGSAMLTAAFWPGLLICTLKLQQRYRLY